MTVATNVKYLKDYTQPDYRILSTNLHFDLEPSCTRVTNTMVIERLLHAGDAAPLQLDGEDQALISIKLDDKLLAETDYQLTDEQLIIANVPASFTLQVITEINPAANTRLDGLYVSSGNFCTQCESHGFRRITYFLDRPDNLSKFTTTLVADKANYPVLLSNGNRVDSGDLDNDKHWVTWEDPFLKPSYLFALVAGKLDRLDDEFITMSGRKVTLHLYVDPGELDKADFAMQSLKQAMRWDEQKYGREYDLDIFMIVAVHDFNMGAMENKGLNIFNSACVFANPQTATDLDYEYVLRVVAHEYFHNWSGNRVTCRNWFQLSLKEGFTVFRDQSFTADHTSAAIKRIDDVNLLRTHQFSEDNGPIAHPVLPKSYIEMNNFYTVTIYEKGAELIRMMHTLLGETAYRKATDLYFEHHDGQAVTIEDFIRAMEDGSGKNLTQFRRWYDQAGTPHVSVTSEYDADKQQFRLHCKQSIPSQTHPEHLPLHIPLAMGLLNQKGEALLPSTLVEITELEQTIVFDNIAECPIPSLLRGFSAPIKLDYDYSNTELTTLLTHDTDAFCCYEAAQQLATRQLEQLIAAYQNNQPLIVAQDYLQALQQIAQANFEDKALQALLLTLPNKKQFVEQYQRIDVDAIVAAYHALRQQIAQVLTADLLGLYQANQLSGDYQYHVHDTATRRIKNTCLLYLSELDQGELAYGQYTTANNMTDVMAALNAMNHFHTEHRELAMADFKKTWSHEPLVMNKWFSLQASADVDYVLEQLLNIEQDPLFNITNPNSVRALFGGFASGNFARFHAKDGSGYQYFTDKLITLDELNPQITARLVQQFAIWRKLDDNRQTLVKTELQRLAQLVNLSKNTREMVEKLLVG